MRDEILKNLKKQTEEEKWIKSGQGINRSIYQTQEEISLTEQYRINAVRLLEQGKLITIRKHTRYVHFPAHTHNYVEVVYMCSGSTRHIINGTELVLRQGELLFLNQNSVQEIFPAGENDIAVNFIILPEFFDYAFTLLNTEESMLRDFLIDCMTGANERSSYLHFKVADILPVQNLVENLIWTLMNKIPNKRSINQMTMGLLLLQLLDHADSLETGGTDAGDRLTLEVLKYIDENYKNGELKELAAQLHYDVYWLSREIKQRIGQNYTELVQNKRLAQAGYLLQNTELSVMDVALAVGYENISYFHRIFKKKYGCSPRTFRIK